MHLSSVDLNLLVVLDALLTTRSTTLAAKRLALSQPATSHALARLRELFDDPLLVRQGRGLSPTPFAEGLALRVRASLESVEAALAKPARFVPESSERLFEIGAGDYASSVLVPPLAVRLGKLAPRAEIFVKHVIDAPKALARGEVELCITPVATEVESYLRSEALFRERFVCLVREGHPLGRSKLTLDRFCSEGHVLVAPVGSSRLGAVDSALARHGRTRRVAVALPSFFVAPSVVAGTDYILTIASRIGRPLARELGLRVLEPPIAIDGFEVHMTWHARHDGDAAHVYLRDAVRAVARRA